MWKHENKCVKTIFKFSWVFGEMMEEDYSLQLSIFWLRWFMKIKTDAIPPFIFYFFKHISHDI